MSAIDEIRAGRPGEAMRAVAMRAGARVVNDFPPPEGLPRWTAPAIEAQVASLFAGKKHLLTKALAAGVADDDALEAFLLRAMRNFMIDEAKKTEVGKFRSRLATVLSKDDRFHLAPGTPDTWTLAGAHDARFAGELDQLRTAAAAVRGVYIADLNHAGPTPKATADVIRTIAAAVLTAASAAVTAQDLARVILERIFPAAQTQTYLADTLGGGDLVADEPGPGFVIEIDSAARAVHAQLSEHERALIEHLHKPPAQLAGVLPGVGPAQTAAIAASAKAKVAAAVLDDADAEQVVTALGALCRAPS